MMKYKYMPIDSDYTELLESEMAKNNSRVIYFSFSKEPELEESNGKIIKIENIKDEGSFLLFDNGDKVRLDRIVVINGKPGPAYDEYDAYALAPLTCKAGYDESMC
jgi:uncharacterized protein (UPF0248 family)